MKSLKGLHVNYIIDSQICVTFIWLNKRRFSEATKSNPEK